MTGPAPSAAPPELATELGRTSDELAALDAIGKLAASTSSIGDFLAEAGRVVQSLTGCRGCAVYAHDVESNTIELLHHLGLPQPLAAQVARAPVEPPAVFTTAQATADVVSPSVYLARFRPVFDELGVTALARVPLVVGARTVGVLAVAFSDQAPEQAKAHLRFLRPVGAIVGAAISSDRHLGSLRRRVSELTLLNDLAVASAQLDPVYLLDGALRRIADVFGAAMGAAFLRHDDGLHNVALFGVRPEKARDALVVPLGSGPCGTAVQRREVVTWTDPEAVGGLFAANMRGEGIRAVVGVPLLSKEEPVGGFVLGRRTDHPFTEEDRRFLTTLAVQLGVAVENSRLYAEARRQVAHLESMHALALRVFVHPPGDQVALLRDGCREIAAALDAPTAAAFLVSDDRRTLRCLALHGSATDLEPVALPLDADPLAAEAVRGGQAGQTPDSQRQPGSAMGSLPGAPSMSLLVVPLGSRDVGRGVVFVGDRTGRTFDDREVALARAMAAALALGLENVGLEVDLGKSNAELERTQEQLLQRERLAALGALSAAVAHEVRNPLGVIFNAVGMLRRHRGTDDEGRGLVDIVAEEAERLNRIVADLLGFARPNPASLRPASLGPIVEEAVRAGLAGSRIPIDVSWELSTELPPVAVDSGLVRQALINVVVNAAQAMPRGGRLQVRTAAAAGWATIEVTDSGHGIPPELRERVFEPFFTTRTSGTGLGLAIVRHVVEAHGGSIAVAPGADGGTRFALRLPLVPGGSAPAAPPNIG